MFSPSYGAAGARHRQLAGQYHSVGVQTSVATASPHQLVSLLFDAVFLSLNRARAAIEQNDTATKAHHIAHAVRIVDEGLRAGLNLKEGGKLAEDLADLYAYVELRLTHANIRNDADALTECLSLLQPLRDAWAEIAP